MWCRVHCKLTPRSSLLRALDHGGMLHLTSLSGPPDLRPPLLLFAREIQLQSSEIRGSRTLYCSRQHRDVDLAEVKVAFGCWLLR